MNSVTDKIQIKQTQIAVERDPVKKQKLQKELLKLRLHAQIEKIQKQLEGLA